MRTLKKHYWKLYSVFLITYFTVPVLFDIGTKRPAYTVDIWMFIGGAIMILAIWMAGFLTAIEIKDEEEHYYGH